MFLYREHRGSLSESMKTVKEMKAFTDLKLLIESSHGEGEITIEPYCCDSRINWNTHIVCLNGAAVGFTNGPVEH